MKIDIIGATQRQTINFDDYPVGIKVKIGDKRNKYYYFRDGKITRSFSTKFNRVLDKLNYGNGRKKNETN